MIFTGRISQMYEERSGVSQRTGKPWASREFIVECKDTNNRTNVIPVDTVDADCVAKLHGAKIGDVVEIDIIIFNSPRTWNDRTFNEPKVFLSDVRIVEESGF